VLAAYLDAASRAILLYTAWEQERNVKLLAGFLVAAYLVAGCAAAGGSIPHDDSAGATKRDEGPVLCKDGSTPPCNDRD